MKNIYIYCESATEESFVNEILYPYFINANAGIIARPIVCATKRTVDRKYKGGVNSYFKIKRELAILCKSYPPNEHIATMFDYYVMPADTTGIGCDAANIFERSSFIEKEINADIGQHNCKFHLMLHEFEGLLFSQLQSFSLIIGSDVVHRLQEIRDSFETPEHINNPSNTASSKRIETLLPKYANVKNGTLISKDMGIDVIIRQCPHFREWIQTITALAKAKLTQGRRCKCIK